MIVGVTVVIVEYAIVQPMRDRKAQGTQAPVALPAAPTASSLEQTQPVAGNGATTQDILYFLSLLFTSSIGSVGAALILRILCETYAATKPDVFLSLFIAEPIAQSDFVFLILLVLMIFSGVVPALLVDRSLDPDRVAPWNRLMLGCLIGFIGASLGAVIVPLVLLVAFIVYGELTSSQKPVKWPETDG